MILKCTSKNCLINVFTVFFPQLFNDVSSFSKIFHFHLQKVQNMLYLQKCIFNNFFYPLDRKLSIFYVGHDIFQRVPEMFLREIECERDFEDENGKFRTNYLHHCKTEEKIRRNRLSNNFFKYFLVSYTWVRNITIWGSRAARWDSWHETPHIRHATTRQRGNRKYCEGASLRFTREKACAQ